ncbi:fatty-acyl-CoA synthase [Geodermatophilus amargosae]|uniref:Fatty-acyl-CoA synthase n=1 Tax=Geodermatophilus amargosae TaxID=1296565 RepID=A0A1I7C3C8_9ACTN|nr:AMP-binding protein [Geodermatophilus amargosae]SFT93909.1 fatty-acyl-CoA synthase [Geodermatophilus amargosae]
MDTYVQDLVTVLQRDGRRPVLRHAGTDTTAAELVAAASRHARALASLGVGPGDLVAIFAPNRPEALAVRYGAHLAGAGCVFLPAPPDLDRRTRLVAQVDPRLLVVFPETAGLLPDDVAAPVAAVGTVPGIALRLDALAAGLDGRPPPCRARPADLAVVVPSGGTTGVPKGSRRDFATYTAMVAGPARPDRRQLANGSLAHLTQVLVDQTLLGGGTVVLQDSYDAAATLAAVEDERVTDLFLVEPQLFDLMDSPEVARYDLGSLRTLTHVGALAPPVLRARARARLGPVVAHTYGASEVGIVSALSPAEHDRPSRFSCAGHVLPGVQVRFRRSDGTTDLRAGAVEVRSPGMAEGYRNRPDAEAAAFVDGWYRTGDLGYLGDEGMLRVLGRVTDTAGPGTVLPVDLQETVCRLPSVRYAVVVPDSGRGVRVVAAEAWPGGEVDVASVRAAVTAEHGREVAASVQVLPVDRVPLTEQGKPDRAAVRAAAAVAGVPA